MQEQAYFTLSTSSVVDDETTTEDAVAVVYKVDGSDGESESRAMELGVGCQCLTRERGALLPGAIVYPGKHAVDPDADLVVYATRGGQVVQAYVGVVKVMHEAILV